MLIALCLSIAALAASLLHPPRTIEVRRVVAAPKVAQVQRRAPRSPAVRAKPVAWVRPAPKPVAKPVAKPSGAIGWPWNALADCESGDGDGRPPYTANWAYNGSSGFDGGVQFLPSTWRNAGGTKYAAHAWGATAAQQVEIAKSWLARTSWSQWPACSRKLGLR